MANENELETSASETEKLIKKITDEIFESLKSMEIREYCIDEKGRVIDRERSACD